MLSYGSVEAVSGGAVRYGFDAPVAMDVGALVTLGGLDGAAGKAAISSGRAVGWSPGERCV